MQTVGIILIFVAVLAVIILVAILSAREDPQDVKLAYAGKSETQKQIIRYFMIAEQGFLKEKLWTDEDFDDYFNDAIKNTRERALEKLGIDEEQVKEIEPISFQNMMYHNDLTDKSALFKRGKDGKWRSSVYQANWLFFSDKQIFVCKTNLSFTDDTIKDRTFEYFYKDITNISTEEKSEYIQRRGNLPYIEFKIIVPGDSFKCELYNTDKNEERERSIKAMRALLREKKA